MRCVAASEIGKRFVSESDDMTRSVWNLKSGEVVNARPHGRARPLCGVAENRIGRRVVPGFEDKTVRVWEIESGEVVNAPPVRCGALP